MTPGWRFLSWSPCSSSMTLPGLLSSPTMPVLLLRFCAPPAPLLWPLLPWRELTGEVGLIDAAPPTATMDEASMQQVEEEGCRKLRRQRNWMRTHARALQRRAIIGERGFAISQRPEGPEVCWSRLGERSRGVEAECGGSAGVVLVVR